MALKAAPEAQALLLDLQSIDTRLAQLEHRERHLPERAEVARLSSERDTARGDVIASRGVLEDLRAELRRVEADVEVVDARIARDNERMLATSSAKDASAFEHEILSLRRRKQDLEEIELAVMEKVEEHEAALAGIQSRLDDLAAQLEGAERAVASALEAIADERAQLAEQRTALVAELPADLVGLYERQRSRYGVGASLLYRGVSQASGVALLADELAAVRSAAPDDVLICPSSEAILVRTAESGL